MPRPLRSLQEEFDEFVVTLWPDTRDRPYPAGPFYEALRKAFFGGCLIAHVSRVDFKPELKAWRGGLSRNVSATHSEGHPR